MLELLLSILSAKQKETLAIDSPQEYNFLQLKEYVEDKYSIPTYVQKYVCKGKMLTQQFGNDTSLQQIFGDGNKKPVLVTVSGEVQKQEMKQLRIDDILGYVISFLTLEEVFNCLRVCKNWYQITSQGSYKNADRFVLLPDEKQVLDLLTRKIVHTMSYPLVSLGNFAQENFHWMHSLPQENAADVFGEEDPQFHFMIENGKLICFQLVDGVVKWRKNLEDYNQEFSIQQKLKRISLREESQRRQRRLNATIQGIALNEEPSEPISNSLLVVHYDNKTKTILAQFKCILLQLSITDGSCIKSLDLDEFYTQQALFNVPILGYLSMSSDHWIVITAYHVMLFDKSTLTLTSKIPLQSEAEEQYMIKMVTTGIKKERYLIVVGTDQSVRVVDVSKKKLIFQETLHNQEGNCFTNDYLFCNGDRLYDFEEHDVTIRASHIQDDVTRSFVRGKTPFAFYETISIEEQIPKLEGFFTLSKTADRKTTRLELHSLLREEKVVYKNRERKTESFYVYNTVYGWDLEGLKFDKWSFATFGEKLLVSVYHKREEEEEDEQDEIENELMEDQNEEEQEQEAPTRQRRRTRTVHLLTVLCLNCKTGSIDWKQEEQLQQEVVNIRIYVKNFHVFVVNGIQAFLYTMHGKLIWNDEISVDPNRMRPNLNFISVLQ